MLQFLYGCRSFIEERRRETMRSQNGSPICRRILFVVLGMTVLLSSACQSVKKVAGELKKPSATITGVHFQNLNMDALTLLFDMEVNNPYSVALPLANVEYGLSSNGQQFVDGLAGLQESIPAKQSKTVPVPVEIGFMEALRALDQIRPGAIVPYKAEMALSVDAPGKQTLRLPLTREGSLPIPSIPTLSLRELRWDQLSLDEAKGMLRVHLVNQNEFPVDLSSLFYRLALADTEIASAKVQQSAKFAEKGGEGDLEIPLSFSPKKLGLAVFQMLMGAEAGYSLDGTMDMQTPYGPIPMPFTSLGKVPFRK